MPEHRDPAASSSLATEDAIELTELLTFLSDWLDGPDSDQLAASLSRFVATAGYELVDLQTDLDRLAGILSGDHPRSARPAP